MMRLFLLVIGLLAVGATATWRDAEGREFDQRWDRCTGLAKALDTGLGRADVGQMVEDCMDNGGPIESLEVRR